MSTAHERAARRLASVSAAEHDWILARLTPADALRIRELMEREPTLAPAEPADEVPSGAQATPESHATPESRVARAAAADVSQALRDEPDWLVALVLAQRRWPWEREVLSGLEPARLAALGELMRKARDAAKPRACEEALGALAAKLRELESAPQASGAFDGLLTRMTAGGEPAQRGEAWQS